MAMSDKLLQAVSVRLRATFADAARAGLVVGVDAAYVGTTDASWWLVDASALRLDSAAAPPTSPGVPLEPPAAGDPFWDDDGLWTGQPIVATAGVIEYAGEVFMLRKPAEPDGSLPARWVFPGGRMRRGERPEACVAREVHEEAGLYIAQDSFRFDGVTHVVTRRMAMVGLVYRAEVTGREYSEARNAEPHKHDDWGWFAWDGLPHPLMDGVRQWMSQKLAAGV